MSQITTHVLDTSKGKPASGIPVLLEKKSSTAGWTALADGMTNSNGRIPDLLNKKVILKPGQYRLTFETAAYFRKQRVRHFYPFVQVVFEITGKGHYHVPLLLSPFGFATYRGS